MRLLRQLVVIALAITGTVAVAAQPANATSNDYGPQTCLIGYVWRGAFAGDVVCVPPDRRDATNAENAAGPGLVDPNGAYGPDTCIQGYVWRDAAVNNPWISGATDHVCVTPAIRSQVAWENTGQIAGGRALLEEVRWTSRLLYPFVLEGDGFNPGLVWIGFYRDSDNSLIWGTDVTATVGGNPDEYPNWVGYGNLTTPFNNCTYPAGSTNSYIASYDWTSGVWTHTLTPVEVC
jgi:hypothetical protein